MVIGKKIIYFLKSPEVPLSGVEISSEVDGP